VLVREQEVLAMRLVLGLDDGGCFHVGSFSAVVGFIAIWPRNPTIAGRCCRLV
jgi:hypothetical protein